MSFWKYRQDNMCIRSAEEFIPIQTKFNGLNERKKMHSINFKIAISITLIFYFRTHCFICGQAVKGREIDVFPVRTNDLQTTVLKVCQEQNDDWAVTVRGRIETINDLHAADVIYNQTCSVDFRTSKAVPKTFFPVSKRDDNRGRPKKHLK